MQPRALTAFSEHNMCWEPEHLTLPSSATGALERFLPSARSWAHFPSHPAQSNLIHLIMWCVAIAAMNPAAATQKTDKKFFFSFSFFPLSTHPGEVRVIFWCSESNPDRLMPPMRAALWWRPKRKTRSYFPQNVILCNCLWEKDYIQPDKFVASPIHSHSSL